MMQVKKNGLTYIKVYEKESGESAFGPERNVMRWVADMKHSGFSKFTFIRISKEEAESENVIKF